MYILKKVGDTYNTLIKYWECDTENDKDILALSEKISLGDECYVYESHTFYIADSSKTFQPQPTSSGGGGTSNYNELSNLPKINGVIIRGELSLDQLGIPSSESFITNNDHLILDGGTSNIE